MTATDVRPGRGLGPPPPEEAGDGAPAGSGEAAKGIEEES